MSTAIRAEANLNYGGTLVSQKYNPLTTIRIKRADKAFCSKMFTDRSQVLRSLGVRPSTLELAAISWSQIVKFEKEHKKPPLVVISSNRSKWIKAGIEAGDAKLIELRLKNFAGVTDLRALKMNAIHPPIYSPKRIDRPQGKELDRNVYVVVDILEFPEYDANLAPKGITVIGWYFDALLPLTGFGASRFAAIEFCKVLRTKAGNPWDYIWLFDDNVVAINPFMGLASAEQLIKDQNSYPQPQACFGFHGSDEVQSNSVNYKWALATTPSKDNRSTEKGILQQAVLWNIKYLKDGFLNFPLIFLASAEDVSLSRYFDRRRIPYNFFMNDRIRKEVTTFDGARDVITLIDYFAAVESITKPTDPPPPVSVQNNEGRFTVSTFVDNRVLPNSALQDTKAKATNHRFRDKAACQAVEQIMKVAIQSADWVDDAALTATFVLPTREQVVRLRNLVLDK